jgi:hypothetical protein
MESRLVFKEESVATTTTQSESTPLGNTICREYAPRSPVTVAPSMVTDFKALSEIVHEGVNEGSLMRRVVSVAPDPRRISGWVVSDFRVTYTVSATESFEESIATRTNRLVDPLERTWRLLQIPPELGLEVVADPFNRQTTEPTKATLHERLMVFVSQGTVMDFTVAEKGALRDMVGTRGGGALDTRNTKESVVEFPAASVATSLTGIMLSEFDQSSAAAYTPLFGWTVLPFTTTEATESKSVTTHSSVSTSVPARSTTGPVPAPRTTTGCVVSGRT